MIFGYANGTDIDIDISIYLNDHENYQYQDLFYSLNNNITIDNNIFSYVSAQKIKLIYIPKEILLTENGNELKNNSIVNTNNGHYLEQNIELIKTSRNYYLDYQYIITESDEELDNINDYYNEVIYNYNRRAYYG